MVHRALVQALLIAIAATYIGSASANETNDNDIHAQLVDLQRRHVGWLLDHPDVTGVDVNHKTVGGEQTDQLSLVIWVKKKLPEEEVSEKRRLPRDIEGFPTDVVEGEIEPVQVTIEDENEPTQTCIPDPSPCMNFTETVIQTCTPETTLQTSTTTETITSTTTETTLQTCTTTETTQTSTQVIPTCTPVIQTSTTTETITQTCTPVTQMCTPTETITPTSTPTESMPMPTPTPTPDPCPCRDPLTGLRGGHCIRIKNSDSFGTLGYFTRKGRSIGVLSNFHVTGGRRNRLTSTPIHLRDFVATVSCAQCNKFIDASHSNLCRRPPPPFMLVDGTVVPGARIAQCYDRVRFCGCTSGCTETGRIFSTNFCGLYRCTPSSPAITVCNQILFTPVAIPGDSGSLLINADTNEATGLVFARVVRQINGVTTYPYGLANHIQTVLDLLGVTLAV